IADHLIEGFDPHKTEGLFKEKSLESKYYKAILQNLFFAMLNSPITAEDSTEISERHFRNGRGDYDNNKLMRYEYYFSNPQLFVDIANRTVPFLNGGLFDCLDEKDKGMYYDGFSDRDAIRKSLVIPDFLFFGDEAGKDIDLSIWYGDKKKKKVSARGIIDILKRYNFTVEENTPFDKEVSLDPELLGKVFENLLASFNPETQTTARKQTGSFYTPREIVQYMVDESLVAHLKRTVGEELEPKFRQLIQYTDEQVVFTDEQRKQIMQSLYDCKILDPACGSGAFPMGILQQMVHILGRIDPDNEQWKEMMMNQAISETSDAYRNASKDERSEMIADIERSFDENVNRPDYARKLYLIENCIYGVDIQPIAIQISKLRFFISLVVDQNTNTSPADNFGIRPLPNLEAKFVAANTLIGLDKMKASLFDSDAIKAKEEEMKRAKHKIFASKYKTKRKYRDRVNELRQEIADLLMDCGAIGNTEAQQLASWDMFNQNASSLFFDPEWMFGVKGGFDIVIGNPPYVFTRDVEFSGDFKKYIETEYFSKVNIGGNKSKANQSGKINLFAIFVMKGVMLNSKSGVLIYIIPNNILRTTTYNLVRKYILDNTSIDLVVDLGSGVFENVTASTVILQLKNVINNMHKVKIITQVKDIEQKIFETSSIPQNQFLGNISYTFNIFGKNVVNDMTNKIKGNTKTLGIFCDDIIEGIVAHKHLIKDNLEEGYVPMLEGKCVRRYYNEIENKYLLWNKKLIHRPRPDYLWELPNKIIIQRISGGKKPLVATIDRNKFKTFASVNNLVLKDEYSSLYRIIVALLNSNVLNWYYANNFSNNSKLTVNISKTYLEMLPIPNITSKYKERLDKLVDEVMQKKNIDSQTDTTAEEQEIDRLVYHLYGLTYNEVLIIDPGTPINREEYNK
ncbi:MAG: TaqI-like C-terminal specificity domain-containing protein, partial [Bacteroidaceae bacterium]